GLCPQSGGSRPWIFLGQERNRGGRPGSSAGLGAASRDQKPAAPPTTKNSLVEEGPEMARRRGGTHQCAQTSPRPEPLSLQRACGNEAMGGAGRHRRHLDQHRRPLRSRGGYRRGRERIGIRNLRKERKSTNQQ